MTFNPPGGMWIWIWTKLHSWIRNVGIFQLHQVDLEWEYGFFITTTWIRIWIWIPEYGGIVQILDFLILDFTPLAVINNLRGMICDWPPH